MRDTPTEVHARNGTAHVVDPPRRLTLRPHCTQLGLRQALGLAAMPSIVQPQQRADLTEAEAKILRGLDERQSGHRRCIISSTATEVCNSPRRS